MPPDGMVLDVDGIHLHALGWGEPDGRPVVLVHGNGAHARWWSFIAPLIAVGRRVAAIDLGGMGDSGVRDRYSPDSYAAEIDALGRRLLADTGRESVDVVAHSFGGLVATWWASGRPAFLGRLILVDVPFMTEGYRPLFRRRGAYRAVFADRDTALARFRLLPDQPCENGFLVDHIAEHSLVQTADGWTWKARTNPWDHAGFQGEFWERLAWRARRVSRPVSALRGGRSAICGPEMEARWRELFGAGVDIRLLADAHHHIMLDTPLELVRLLDQLLA